MSSSLSKQHAYLYQSNKSNEQFMDSLLQLSSTEVLYSLYDRRVTGSNPDQGLTLTISLMKINNPTHWSLSYNNLPSLRNKQPQIVTKLDHTTLITRTCFLLFTILGILTSLKEVNNVPFFLFIINFDPPFFVCQLGM